MNVYNRTTQPHLAHKKLKILFICSWYASYDLHQFESYEGHPFFTVYAKDMQKYCDVALWVPFDKLSDKNFNDEYEWGVRTFRSEYKPGWIKHICLLRFIRRFFHILKCFMKIRRTFMPDVIHAHAAMQAGLWSTFISKIFRIPVIITEHWPIEYMNLESRMSRFKHRIAYTWSERNLCVSKDLCERLIDVFKNINFDVMYNGIRELPHDASSVNYRQEGYINCVIVAAFYAKDVKGFQYLLPAMKILTQDLNIPLMLHIVGGGTYFEHYRNMAQELGIMNHCIFHGKCSRHEVYSIVSEMDFGISASLFESAGVNVEEMMLMGKPLVVTRSGGASSLVADFAAIIVDKGSTEALVNGIKEMSERYMTYDHEAIRDYAKKNFDLSNMTLQYFKLYQECLNK